MCFPFQILATPGTEEKIMFLVFLQEHPDPRGAEGLVQRGPLVTIATTH